VGAAVGAGEVPVAGEVLRADSLLYSARGGVPGSDASMYAGGGVLGVGAAASDAVASGAVASGASTVE
jgi:hypothetical protein